MQDLWRLSREDLDLSEFLSRHGYHGLNEGEVSAVSWREDPSGVEMMSRGYAAQPDAQEPEVLEAAKQARRIEAEKRFLAGLPRHKRASARMIFAMAARFLPLRGVAKVAFLQAIDVARWSARRIGDRLVDQGALGDREDVFLLTLDEVLGGPTPMALARVDERREVQRYYRSVEIPFVWQGLPDPAPVVTPSAERTAVTLLEGVGASPGTVEGTVRVVTDPSEDFAPGEILVTYTTDPGWASLMFLASALVVDIGGELSHAAVVARELGIPCVMNTGNGTKVLRSGDVCHVDGKTGRVEIIAPI